MKMSSLSSRVTSSMSLAWRREDGGRATSTERLAGFQATMSERSKVVASVGYLDEFYLFFLS